MKICPRCGKTFTKISSHLVRKKECPGNYLDIDRNLIINDYDNYYDEYIKIYKNNYGKNSKNIGKKYECSYCSKTFTDRSNCNRHQKHYCKKQSNNIYNQTNQNADVINNITNNVTNNVTFVLNNFGEEAPITIKELVKILNECSNKDNLSNILPLYIKKRWIDNEDNRNINVIDLNRGMAEIYVNKEWEKKFLNEVIDIIRNKSSKDIYNYVVQTKKYLEEKYENDYMNHEGYKKANDVRNHMYDTENIPEIKRDVNKKIKLELINNRNKVRETKKSIKI